MWFETLEPGYGWESLWYGYVRCNCGGIRLLSALCPACGERSVGHAKEYEEFRDGKSHLIPQMFMGAEGRSEDYVYLQLMEREWNRPTKSDSTKLAAFPAGDALSDRTSIVLLFWTYFESRIERLIFLGLEDVPTRIRDDLINRYASVGARMDKLYRILFGTTYRADLNAVGAVKVFEYLLKVQKLRNEFVHGNPAAIADELVRLVVRTLRDEHEAWIAVFNLRIRLSKTQS